MSIKDIDNEIAEYNLMIDHAIQTNDRESLKMWRKALNIAKITKRRLVDIS